MVENGILKEKLGKRENLPYYDGICPNPNLPAISLKDPKVVANEPVSAIIQIVVCESQYFSTVLKLSSKQGSR